MGGEATPWASLFSVDDHCFEDFRYAASIWSIYPSYNNEEVNLHSESTYIIKLSRRLLGVGEETKRIYTEQN